MEKFYIYEYYNTKTGEVFYVGKGTGRRYLEISQRNSYFRSYISSHPYSVRITQYFSNEEEAYKKEEFYIKKYKAENQCCCNLDNGGLGGMSGKWTQEQREQMSVKNPMKTERNRQKMTISNPMLSEEQKQRMKQENPMQKEEIKNKVSYTKHGSFIFNGKEFYSFTELGNILGVNYNTIRNWKNNNIEIDKLLQREKDDFSPLTKKEKSIIASFLTMKTRKEKEQHYNGEENILFGVKYESQTEAAKVLGVSRTSVRNYLKNEERILKQMPQLLKRKQPLTKEEKESISKIYSKKSKSVIIDGIIYPSLEEAAKAVGLKPAGIRYRCNNINYPNFLYADNQQPSR